MPKCIEWGEERHQECTETRDESYRDCCDWVPCSWFCDAWVWVSSIVCIGWTWITTTFCVLWDVVTTIINAVLVSIESILGWVLSAVAFIIELIEMIPVIGTLVRWIFNGISYVLGLFGSLVDAALGAIGIRPEKILRVCTVILRDNGAATANTADVVAMLQMAADVYKRDANIRLVPLRAFKYSSGFADADTVDTSWVQVDANDSDADLLDPACSVAGEWGLAGTKFQFKVSTLCFYGSWRRVLGYGAPITVFIVRDIPGALGCSLGIVDYVTVDGMASLPTDSNYSPRTIGHEIGHSCMLPHSCVDDEVNNMMATSGACNPASTTAPNRTNPVMGGLQAVVVRSSKHVTYF